MMLLRIWVLWIFIGSLILTTYPVIAQDSFKIYLVGDAGDHTESGGTLKNLKTELTSNPNSAVIFLGDNSYKDILWGLIPFGFKGFDSSTNTMDKIRSQLSILDNYGGSAFFTPGNHDWWNRTTYLKGRPKLEMEESFIEENLILNTHIANPANVFLPHHGGYGPEFVELDKGRIRIIFIDTYRIIQTGIKKAKKPPEEESFYNRLDSLIHAGYLLNQKIIVVAHHPVHSLGPYNEPLKHPYLERRIKASNATFPSYQAMSQEINKILNQYPGIYYASGHVHALQYYLTKDSLHYIVSGSGSKEKILTEKEIRKYDAQKGPNDYLLWNSGGFFEIDFDGEKTNTFLYYDDASKKCTIP
jgi:DNA repair exonuclease SbcCD nuclease subunit